MDRGLKKLLQLYPIARNWTVLSNYIVPFRSIQCISQTCNTDSTNYTQLKNVTLFPERHVSSNIDISNISIKRQLKKATTNYKSMTANDALGIMSALYRMSAYAESNDEDAKSIGKHIGFINLCDVIHRNVRFMHINDILTTLKIAIHFKIPSDSNLIQTLLQIIRTNINEMHLGQIIFTNNWLRKMDSTPLRDALLIALPIVFEAQLLTKLDPDDVVLLRRSLKFAIENNIQNPEVQNMILKIWKCRSNVNTTQTDLSIFHSLCHASHLSQTAFDILPDLQKILLATAKKLNTKEINKVLSNLSFVIENNKEDGCKFYDEALVDALINSALSSNISFEFGIHLLNLLNDINHVHLPLLEYLAAKCFEQPNLLKEASYSEIFTVLKGFTNADYKPVFWDTIRDMISASKVENRSYDRSLIQFTLYLTALDYYSPTLLSNVFSNCRNDYVNQQLILYQSVKILYPMYNGPWPQQLEHVTNFVPKFPMYPLKSALELALGGPQYVRNNVWTKFGHFIDHVVVMRKGGYPVAINVDTPDQNNKIYVEDLQTPNESQTILIFNIPSIAYAVNSQRIKSTWLLRIRSAEALTNFDTIAINSSSWMKLPEYERIPYLMQAIKLKCEDVSNVSAY